MTGYRGRVSAPALGELDGQTIAVTGAQVGMLGIWNLATQQQIGESIAGHLGFAPEAVLGDFIDGQGGLTNGSPVQLISDNSMPAIRSLAVTGWTGILGNDDGGAAIVDLEQGTLIHEIPGDDDSPVITVACEQIAGRPIAILNSHRERRVLDVLDGQIINVGRIDDNLLDVKSTSPSSLIVTQGSLMKVHGGGSGTLTLESEIPFDSLLGRHHGAVTAVTCAYLDGRPTAFSGGQDGTVRVWDLLDKQLLDVIDVLGPVFTIWANNNGALLVGAGGEAIAFRSEHGRGTSLAE
jgi:WD40 repeat protein